MSLSGVLKQICKHLLSLLLNLGYGSFSRLYGLDLLLLLSSKFPPFATACNERLGLQVCEEVLADLLNDETSREVNHHRHRQPELELQQSVSKF
jgi:hypothetical protein